MTRMTEPPSHFLITSQYRRFAEICNRSHSDKSLALFFGKSGLGKTECALRYSNWRVVEPLLKQPVLTRKIPISVIHSSTAFFTPDVFSTPKMIRSDIMLLRNRFDQLLEQAHFWHGVESGPFYPHKYLKLLIIDEVHRLSFSSLEQLRELYERTNLSMLLIGPPGMDRSLMRYSQIYDRLTLGYEVQPLNQDEMRLFITSKWKELNLPLTADDTVSIAIMRISNGNLRALHRIFSEIMRLQKLNCFPMITPDLVENARRGLLLGV